MASINKELSEASNESDYYEEHNEVLRGKVPENLISIDTSDEYEDNDDNDKEIPQSNLSMYPSLHRNGNVYRTEEDFQAEINRLKNQSNNRFKSKWEEILEKYAKIDDDKESDEIDLVSGKIITDNGHLRSLRTDINRKTDVKFDGDIWSVTYDLEKDIHNNKVKETRLKQKKKELKRQLKNQKLFHNVSLQSSPLKGDDFSRGSSFALSSEDNLLSLNPSPTKKFKVSPTKSIRGSSPVLDDDISLLTPTKRRARMLSNIYLDQSLPTKLHFDNIPHLRMKGNNINSEIQDIQEDNDLTNTPFFVHTNTLRDMTGSFKTKLKHYDDDTSNTATNSDSKGYSETSETSDVESDDNKASRLSISDQNLSEGNINKHVSDSESDSGEYSLDFDDEFLIVTDPCIITSTETSNKIYDCAFERCHYCTGNKALYQNHLLDKHSNSLHSLGYPTKNNSSKDFLNINMSQNTIRNITKYFPLVLEVPRLPLSKSSQPFTCGLSLGDSKTCQKFFVTKNDLISHQKNAPSECSCKKQVLICPMLGCGYMTDMGYLEWRSHFLEKMHHLDPKFRINRENERQEGSENGESNLSLLSYVSNPNEEKSDEISCHFDKIDIAGSNNTKEGVPAKASTILDVVNEINDIFSDSGSDASLSDYLRDDKTLEFGNKETKLFESQKSYNNRVPNLEIKLNLHEDSSNPLDEDLHTGHESIEELFDD